MEQENEKKTKREKTDKSAYIFRDEILENINKHMECTSDKQNQMKKNENEMKTMCVDWMQTKKCPGFNTFN